MSLTVRLGIWFTRAVQSRRRGPGGMRKVGFGLRAAGDGEALRYVAGAEAGNLREDEPHPVVRLRPARSSASTCAKTLAWASTKRWRLCGSDAERSWCVSAESLVWCL